METILKYILTSESRKPAGYEPIGHNKIGGRTFLQYTACNCPEASDKDIETTKLTKFEHVDISSRKNFTKINFYNMGSNKKMKYDLSQR